MSVTFVVAPKDGWQVGDRAYCVHGSPQTTPTLEVGKIYVVEKVIPMHGMVDDGLMLAGIKPPDGCEGIWGTRFLRLRPGERPAAQITQGTTPSWVAAYYASTGRTQDRANG